VDEQSVAGVLSAKHKKETAESQRQAPEARARKPESKRHDKVLQLHGISVWGEAKVLEA